MSHFCVLVIGEDPEAQLAPYHEFECTGVNDQYIVEEDKTGEILELMNREEEPMTLEEALGYHGLDEAIVAQQSEAIVEGQDAKHQYGYAIVVDGKLEKAVRRTNPDAKWDWYTVGGRWTGYFKLKEGAKGERGMPGVMAAPCTDETRADVLTRGDIDIQGMLDDKRKEAGEFWDKVNEVVKDHLKNYIPWSKFSEWVKTKAVTIEQAREAYHSQKLVKALANSEDKKLRFIWELDDVLIPRDEYVTGRVNQTFATYAFVKDGEWVEKGEMGWFGMSLNEMDQEDWNKQFMDMFINLPDDTPLTLVDCHI